MESGRSLGRANLLFPDSWSSGGSGSGSGGAKQNFSTVLQQIFNSDSPILPAPVTDAEAMARVPAASVVDPRLPNYTIMATTTIAGSSNRSFLEAEPVVGEEEWLDTLLLVLQATVMISIMAAAIFGNLLVIASVMRHRKLR